MKRFIIIALSICCVKAGAAEPGERMSGYSLQDFPNFEKEWKLITVRFRRDTGEMRFVYANELALKTLQEKKNDFPEGAVFAKVGVATQDDPLFISSAVPAGAKRYQLMVRSKTNGKETGGWAYALFNDQGKMFPEPEKRQVQACYACHKVARSRGEVFSELMSLTPKAPALPPPWYAGEVSETKFHEVPTRLLPTAVAGKVPSKFKGILSLQGALRVHLFQGSLDEVRPTLAKEALENQKPAALISESGERFSLVIPTEDSCADSGRTGRWMTAYTSTTAGSVQQIKFCQVK